MQGNAVASACDRHIRSLSACAVRCQPGAMGDMRPARRHHLALRCSRHRQVDACGAACAASRHCQCAVHRLAAPRAAVCLLWHAPALWLWHDGKHRRLGCTLQCARAQCCPGVITTCNVECTELACTYPLSPECFCCSNASSVQAMLGKTAHCLLLCCST